MFNAVLNFLGLSEKILNFSRKSVKNFDSQIINSFRKMAKFA
jgi:hypothetical protein